MDFKAKLKNFWYYYKYYLLIGAVLVFALLVAINSCFNRKSYDLSVLYVTYGYSDSFFQTGELISVFDTYVPDTNADGVCNSQFITINYGTTFQESNSAGAQRSANLASGKALLYLLDERNYRELKEGGFLADITELGESEFINADGDAFLAYDSGMLDEVSGFKALNQPHYLCLRVFDSKKADRDEEFRTQYETAKQTLKNIIDTY